MNILKGNRGNRISKFVFLATLVLTVSCSSPQYTIVNVKSEKTEMTNLYDINPDKQTSEILKPYKIKVDSLMNVVIGQNEQELTAYRPESPLSNFAADVLKQGAVNITNKPIDVAITNMGGLRNRLPQGNITVGCIFEIFPFENHLCILTLDGKSLRRLFEQIAYLKGEGVSGIKMIIKENGTLKRVTVDGKTIDPKKKYTVATLDYLSEGNDGLTAFLDATDKQCYEEATIRRIIIEHVAKLTQQGKSIIAKEDGRVKIEK